MSIPMKSLLLNVSRRSNNKNTTV